MRRMTRQSRCRLLSDFKELRTFIGLSVGLQGVRFGGRPANERGTIGSMRNTVNRGFKRRRGAKREKGGPCPGSPSHTAACKWRSSAHVFASVDKWYRNGPILSRRKSDRASNISLDSMRSKSRETPSLDVLLATRRRPMGAWIRARVAQCSGHRIGPS